MMRNPCEKGSHNKHDPAFCTHKRVHTPNNVLAEKSYPSGNCHSHFVNKGPSSVGSIRYASLQRVKNPKSFGWTQWETHIIWVKKSHLLITFSLVPNKKTTITKILQHFFVQKGIQFLRHFLTRKKTIKKRIIEYVSVHPFVCPIMSMLKGLWTLLTTVADLHYLLPRVCH